MNTNSVTLTNNTKIPPKYVQPKHLVKSFQISRTTVWRLLKEMKTIKKYNKSFLDLGWQLKLVKLDDFEQFLQEKNNDYLRK